MFSRILLSLFLLFAAIVGYSADMLTVNNGKIQPTKYNLQLPLYPVFYFSMPEGYTDFELKGTITNFNNPSTGIEDNPGDHLGEEVVFYLYSAYPYVGNTGAAKFQKFDPKTKVYFQVTNAAKTAPDTPFDQSLSWDPRRYIKQQFSNTILDASNTKYAIFSYLRENAKVGGALVIAVGNTGIIKPTNTQLMWTIRFFNNNESEHDGNGKPLYHPIFPVYWIDNHDNRISNQTN